MQLYFIQQRDELCRKGEVLLTPALNYTDSQLTAMLESLCRERMSKEQKDEDERKKQAAAVDESNANSGSPSKVVFELLANFVL